MHFFLCPCKTFSEKLQFIKNEWNIMREFLYEVRVLRNFKDSTLILKTITLMRVKIWHYYSGIFWVAMIEYYNFSQKGVKTEEI